MTNMLEKAFDFAVRHNSLSKTSIVKSSSEVCIYGLGKYFEDAFIRQHIKERFGVTHLCDGSVARRREVEADSRYEGLKCIAPGEIGKLEDPAIIFMLGDPRQAMENVRQILPKEKWYKLITYNDLILDDIMKTEDTCLLGGDIDKALQVYEQLEDEISREVFSNVLCLRIAPQYADKSYEEICTLPQYFPEDVYKLGIDECVIDCGAYTGDTMAEFIRLTGGKFTRYDAFELDEENFKNLQREADYIDGSKVHCHPYGVWDKSQALQYGRMSSADSYSIFNGNEQSEARVVSLDEYLPKEQRCTLIKMDIEGSERQALEGGRGIIKDQKPKLAICVYHRLSDLWEIPIWIKNVRSDYKLYMRHHAEFWVSETVCYGV